MRNAKTYILQSLISKNKEHYEQTKLIINSNGSIKIEGDFEIIDCDGIVYGLEGRRTLGLAVVDCLLQTFCDGSHAVLNMNHG
jgi:plastocyanin domain-containing protein